MIEDGFASLAHAVLAQAVLDFYIGKRGVTVSGNPYPGGWRRRRGPEKERMAELRAEAKHFFFGASSEPWRRLWFRVAGYHRPPVGASMHRWLAHEIDARHPRAPFTVLDDWED